jgi:hypothetical protein
MTAMFDFPKHGCPSRQGAVRAASHAARPQRARLRSRPQP